MQSSGTVPGTWRRLDSQSFLLLQPQAAPVASNPTLSPPLSAHPSRAALEPSRQGAVVWTQRAATSGLATACVGLCGVV